MARATCNIFNPRVGGAGANGHTIISSPDVGAKYSDIRRQLNVNAIGVGAVSGGGHLHAEHFNVVASIEGNVEQLAIE